MRVVFASPMPERVVLNPAASQIGFGVRVFDHGDRIRDLRRSRERIVERFTLRVRHAQGAQTDLVRPRLRLLVDPRRNILRGATLDDLDQASIAPAADIDDQCRPTRQVLLPATHGQCLIQLESPHTLTSSRARGQERIAVTANRVHGSVPVTPQLVREVDERSCGRKPNGRWVRYDFETRAETKGASGREKRSDAEVTPRGPITRAIRSDPSNDSGMP